jgi:hypothetical protein
MVFISQTYSHLETGKDNDEWIRKTTQQSSLLIAGWGVHGSHLGRSNKVKSILSTENIYCLGKTKCGQPKHPLYLSNDTELEKY